MADSSSLAPPPWIELPTDVTANILQRLGAMEILESAEKVCLTWRAVCKIPAIWRVIDMENSGDLIETAKYCEFMCRRAVDRSLGELIQINIEFFGTNDLLLYISERSSQLKCLRLACCTGISGKGLTTVIPKFPELEELHLSYMPYITAREFEAISKCCSMLKSFTFNGRRSSMIDPKVDDRYALSIAKNMPNLHHLGLFGNDLSDEGLRAILDGCPSLESLDIRRCNMIGLKDGLSKRCVEQIKDVRYPFDSIADYMWEDEDSDEQLNQFWVHGLLAECSKLLDDNN
ncbi:hypothetical protein CASFOL_014510 [Castilleja foliolosa]|uniref:F-box domain-containing protein n=1 Tax=Castilleja foliolosa TaxID=1961234 RepID=A0ABD3DN16_9LAMI